MKRLGQINLFLLPILATAVAGGGTDPISSVLSVFRNFSLPNVYQGNIAHFIDFIIYLIIFIGLSQQTLGRRFEGRGGSALTTGMGLALGIAAAVAEYYFDFVLGNLAPLALAILIIVVSIMLFTVLLALGLDKFTATSTTYVTMYFMFFAVAPEYFDWMRQQSNALLGILSIILLIAIWRMFQGLWYAFRPHTEGAGEGIANRLSNLDNRDTTDYGSFADDYREARQKKQEDVEDLEKKRRFEHINKVEDAAFNDIRTAVAECKHYIMNIISYNQKPTPEIYDTIFSYVAKIRSLFRDRINEITEERKQHLKELKQSADTDIKRLEKLLKGNKKEGNIEGKESRKAEEQRDIINEEMKKARSITYDKAREKILAYLDRIDKELKEVEQEAKQMKELTLRVINSTPAWIDFHRQMSLRLMSYLDHFKSLEKKHQTISKILNMLENVLKDLEKMPLSQRQVQVVKEEFEALEGHITDIQTALRKVREVESVEFRSKEQEFERLTKELERWSARKYQLASRIKTVKKALKKDLEQVKEQAEKDESQL